MALRLEIDKFNLDSEWEGQSSQRMHYGELAALAQYDVDEAKNLVAYTAAQLDMQIRNDPQAFGLPKVTEAAVSNAVTLHPRYQEVLRSFNEAKRKLGVIQAAVEGLEHRKRALSMLTDLHLQDYFVDSQHREKPTSMPRGVKERRTARSEGYELDV